MKFFLQTLLCFVFVSAVVGQGYGRRRKPRPVHRPRMPVQRPPFPSNIDAFDSEFGQFSALDSLRRGGMPAEIRRIIGSTVSGESLVGGMNGLPRHGGTLNDNGLINGWGARPHQPANPMASGGELVFDPVLNRYIVVKKDKSIGHQKAKASHNVVNTGGIVTGHVPVSHNTVKAEHNMVKDANHIARKTIAGGPVVKSSLQHDSAKSVGMIAAGKPIVNHGMVRPIGTFNAGHVGVDDHRVIGHNIRKATMGSDATHSHEIAKSSGFPVIGGFLNPGRPVGGQVNHDIVKSTSFGGVDQFGVDPFGQVANAGIVPDAVINHGLVKSDRHVGISKLGTINTGHVGFTPPEVIAHNIQTATLGEDAVAGHNIARSSGFPLAGVGFIDPTGPVATQISHEITKATHSAVVDPFKPVMGHGIAKTTGGIGVSPFGTFGTASDPIHSVHKVGKSGLASQGLDPLAANLGHGIAKKAFGEAAQAVNIGSRGGVAALDPIAIAVTHNLARDSIHVAGKTMDIASSGVAGGRHVGPGMDIFGQGSGIDIFDQVHPQPVKKAYPKITGYGRRPRN